MNYVYDKFRFERQAILKCQMPIDAQFATTITGFEVAGTEPSGSARRAVFVVDGETYKFNGQALVKCDFEPTLENVLSLGNSMAELVAVNNIPAWCGKLIFPVIAISAPADSPVMPTVKLALKMSSFNDVYTRSEVSPVFELNKLGKLSSIDVKTSTTGHGAVSVQVRLKNVSWTDWMRPSEIHYQLAEAIQFKVTYTIATLNGSDSARLDEVTLHYSDGSPDLLISEIFTKSFSAGTDLTTCYAVVKHSRLKDTALKMFVCFAKNPLHKNISLGRGAGFSQTFQLDQNIDWSTLQIRQGDLNVTEYNFDQKNSTVTFFTEADAEIFADYDYLAEAEDWQEMKLDQTWSDGENFVSRFCFALDEPIEDAAVKCRIQVCRDSGVVDEMFLGTATGDRQKFILPHKPIENSVQCTADYVVGDSCLEVQGVIDTPIFVSYDWRGEGVEIFSYAFGCA